MDNPKILHLTLKKRWFDMIAQNVKKEEYREIKPYWVKRLVSTFTPLKLKNFDEVHFTLGYNKNAPKIKIKCNGIFICKGWEHWGAEKDNLYFVISLGEILSVNYYD